MSFFFVYRLGGARRDTHDAITEEELAKILDSRKKKEKRKERVNYKKELRAQQAKQVAAEAREVFDDDDDLIFILFD